jgi:transcriptional regulator with XRE-family HTH domain
MPEAAFKAQLQALGDFIRAQRLASKLSLRELAERTNVSNAYLSQLERGRHEPSLTVLKAIADALGIPLAVLLSHAGVLDGESRDEAGPPAYDTEEAILHDPRLSEPQRVALLSVYRSFVPPRR